jgi:chemotaxis signal transduction protein
MDGGLSLVLVRMGGRPCAIPCERVVEIVPQCAERQVGLPVDDVQSVVQVSPSAIEKPGDLTGVQGPGVVRIGEEMVLVISPEDVIHG